MEEMRQSVKVIFYCISNVISGSIKTDNFKVITLNKNNMLNSLELLMHNFKYYSEGITLAVNSAYTSIESPKGEFGIFLIVNNTNKPYRCKIRAPGYFHLQGLDFMSKNSLLADIVTIIG